MRVFNCCREETVAPAFHRVHIELYLHSNARVRGRRRRTFGAGESGEKRSEVAADDLRWRPPEWLWARLRGFGGDVAAEIARLRAGQQQPAQNGPEWTRCHVDAGRSSDRLGGGVGLLSGDAALLDGKGRNVAGGVDVGHAGDPSVQVNGDESLERLRDAADPRALQARKRDDAIGHDDAVGDEEELALTSLRRIRACMDSDPALVEQLPDGAARLPPEQVQRLVLGRDERDLHTGDTPLVQPGRRHQRQLVGRQCPCRARRNREDDSPYLAGLDLGEQPFDLVSYPPVHGTSAPRRYAGFGTAPQAMSSVVYGTAPPGEV